MKRQISKKIAKSLLACSLSLYAMAGPLVSTAYADAWEWAGDAYQMPDGTAISGAISRGIDVSYWKQEIDWNQVKEDDVDFVMLGTRFRGEVDPYFHINAQKAHEMGIKLGAYIYSYATSVEMAEQEADFVLDLIKDYPISYPVAFDAEDMNTLGTLTPSQVSQVINAFCKKIENAGYHPMVYANEYWLNNKIDCSMIDYDIWVARYNVMYTYDRPSMWQATNTGSVNGVNGNVDINFLFTDYSNSLPANLWRTIGGNTYYYQNHQMQKSDWIHDGTGWFYMDDEGSAVKGWMVMPEGSYYLDEGTGRMATGWQALNGNWYYLKDSGLMATGWRQVDGSWYYMSPDGKMQTGWQEIDGVRYHLADSGSMSVGWQQLDGSRYYFQSSGAMAVGWLNPGDAWYYMDSQGRMQIGWQNVNGTWYYLNDSGAMQTGWQNVNGTWYYLNDSGAMQTGWQNVNGTWYYLNDSGAMQTGWQNINGALYYLDSSGAMAVNTDLEYNGEKYHADGSGACSPVLENANPAAPENPVEPGNVQITEEMTQVEPFTEHE